MKIKQAVWERQSKKSEVLDTFFFSVIIVLSKNQSSVYHVSGPALGTEESEK